MKWIPLMRKGVGFAAVFFLAHLALSFPALAQTGGFINQKCLKCHGEFKEMKNVVAGDFASLSNKAKSIQVDLGDENQIVKFTPTTEVVNAEGIKALKKPIPVLIAYEKQGVDLVATRITAKPVIQVPEENLADVKEIERLVALGPEKGGYMLIDSRPPIRYDEGHIPTAISIPFGAMPEKMDRLPEDKGRLLVFYCEGFR